MTLELGMLVVTMVMLVVMVAQHAACAALSCVAQLLSMPKVLLIIL
jgi:hypothetical protein